MLNWLSGSPMLPTATFSGNMSPQSLVGTFNQLQQQATAGNMQLGQIFQGNSNRIIAQLQNRLDRAFRMLKGTNKAHIRSIDRDFEAKGGEILSNLVSGGLGNSTILAGAEMGLQRAHSDALAGSRAAFGEKLFNALSGSAKAISGLAAQQANVLFQGTNIGYPDWGALASMLGMQGGSGSNGASGGSGLSYVGDPSRPVGGPQPMWAYASGSSAPMAGGFASYPGLAQMYGPKAPTPVSPISSAFGKDYSGDQWGNMQPGTPQQTATGYGDKSTTIYPYASSGAWIPDAVWG